MKKYKDIIIGGLFVIAVVGALIFISKPGSPGNGQATAAPQPEGESKLAAEEKFFDFGEISMAAGKVTRSFKIKNIGDKSVKTGKLYTSCMCTEATLDIGGRKFGPYGMPGHGFSAGINQSIDPGKEASVEVVFDPAAHGPAGVGKIERAVYLENDSGRAVELKFTAFVKP